MNNNTNDDCFKFYGKYRGTVVQNIDPQQIGRVQVIVPDVSHVGCCSTNRCWSMD